MGSQKLQKMILCSQNYSTTSHKIKGTSQTWQFNPSLKHLKRDKWTSSLGPLTFNTCTPQKPDQEGTFYLHITGQLWHAKGPTSKIRLAGLNGKDLALTGTSLACWLTWSTETSMIRARIVLEPQVVFLFTYGENAKWSMNQCSSLLHTSPRWNPGLHSMMNDELTIQLEVNPQILLHPLPLKLV